MKHEEELARKIWLCVAMAALRGERWKFGDVPITSDGAVPATLLKYYDKEFADRYRADILLMKLNQFDFFQLTELQNHEDGIRAIWTEHVDDTLTEDLLFSFVSRMAKSYVDSRFYSGEGMPFDDRWISGEHLGISVSQLLQSPVFARIPKQRLVGIVDLSPRLIWKAGIDNDLNYSASDVSQYPIVRGFLQYLVHNRDMIASTA